MTSQEDALADLARILDELSVPYMIIGGLANARWGEPRATLDIDATLWLAETRIPELVEALAPRFSPRVADPESFVSETRVLPVETADGLGADLILGLLPFEEEAIRRAKPTEIQGRPVRFCTAEDLILLKIVSERVQDRADVRGIARRRKGQLDLEYLEPRVQELADLLERPEILVFWNSVREG
jgi:hypothetical protein